MKRNRSGDSGERRAYDDDDDGNALSTFRSATTAALGTSTAAVSMRMGGEGPKGEAGTQQRGGGLPRSQPGNKVTGPGWWAKLIQHYDDEQKYLAVNFAGRVNKITNAGHHKIVSDLLDKGEWQKAAKAALVAYYGKDTSGEVFQKVLEAPLAGEAAFAVSQANQRFFLNVGSETLRDVVA